MAVGALVKAREWVVWWTMHRGRIRESIGWVRFLVDAITLCHEAAVRDARRLRGPQMLDGDPRGFSADEWHDPVEVAERDLAWFEKHRAEVERTAPAWASFLFQVLDGVLRNRVRLHQETRQILRKGYMTVNVNPNRTRRDDYTGEEEASA